MSNPKKAIQEIKKLMTQFGFMSEESVLKSFKLEDNTILETKNLKAGEQITRLNDEFERVALEDGKFRLVENFEIEVKDGEIKSVKEIFVDAKLEDGTQIKVEGDEIMEGAKVVVVTEEGEIPAPSGVHTLEDGTKIETMEGVITKIEEAEGPEVEIEVEAEEEVKDEVKVEGENPVLDEIVSLLKDMMEKVSQKMKEMEEKVEEVQSEFSSFKSAPAGKKVSDGKTEFNKVNKGDDSENKIAAIMALRNKK